MEIIKLPTFSETALTALADNICTDIETGLGKALNAYIQAKALDELSKKIIDRIKSLAIDEAENYSKAESTLNGASFTLSSTPVNLDFEADDEYRQLNEALKKRRAELTDAYKGSLKGQVIVNDQGEAVPVVPVKKESETTIKISFKG
jgi:hypothetical protein